MLLYCFTLQQPVESASTVSQSVQRAAAPLLLQDALFNIKLVLNAKQTSRCSPESEVLIVAVCEWLKHCERYLI